MRTALIAGLGGDDGQLPMLNARLILRTGVSLTRIDPRHARDPARVSAVVEALRDMGFELSASADPDPGASPNPKKG